MPHTPSSEVQSFTPNSQMLSFLGSDPKQHLVMGFRFELPTQRLSKFQHLSF